MKYFTFQDAIDHASDYLGGGLSTQVARDLRRAPLEAIRELANAHSWSYLNQHGRIVTSPAFDGATAGGYDSGGNPVAATIQYQQTSGTYEFQVTITGATWPPWAGDGTYIRLSPPGPDPLTPGLDPSAATDDSTDFIAYRVAQRVSATVLTLDATLNPQEDLPAGTCFLLYRDTYLLPEDYIAQDQALYERNFGGMTYTHPKDWLYENRYVFAQGIPQAYTITGDRQYPGRLVMRIYPWPYEARTIDFIYKRRPSPLVNASVSAGTVSITGGGNTITGVGTAFTPGMVGSVIRLSTTKTPPTSLVVGTNPAAFESFVTAWASPTSITINDWADRAYAAVGYTISDMVDIEQGSMLNAFLRCVEKHLGMSRTLKDKPSAARQYDAALSEAKSTDSRSYAGRAAGEPGRLRRRLRDMPFTFNIE